MAERSQTIHVIAAAVLTAIAAVSPAQADTINWGTAGQQLFAADGETPLSGHRDRNETTTGFVQLLWLGPNGVYDGLSAAGNGTAGDDQVIATSWVGDGNPVFLTDTPGQFDATDTPPSTSYTSGQDSFAIRVFDTAVSDTDWAAGTIPLGGGGNLFVFNNPLKTADFYNLWIDARLLMPMGNQTIDFAALPEKIYGDAPFALSAHASSGLEVSFASDNEAVVTVNPTRNGWTATVVGAGQATITASQGGDRNWHPAPPVERTLTVRAAALTAIAENKAKVVGSPNPSFGIRYEGLQLADTAPATPPAASCAADASSPPGEYDIVLSGGDDPNYTLNLQTGTLTVVEGLAMRLWATADARAPNAIEFGEADAAAAGGDMLDETAQGQAVHLSCPFPSAAEPRLLTRDFRPPAQLNRWCLEVLDESQRGTVDLSWDVGAAAAGREVWLQQLRDGRPVGFPVDMKTQNELLAVEPGTSFEIIYGILQQATVDLQRGWNAVGTPLLTRAALGDPGTAGRGAGSIRFPVWCWGQDGFEQTDGEGPFLSETGYLIHCLAESATLTVTGLPPDGVFPLATGWNLLSPVETTTLPPVRANGPAAWRWDTGSQSYRPATECAPGQSCWWYGGEEN